MEKISLVLSIVASLGTIASILYSMRLNTKIKLLSQIKGDGNIQTTDSSGVNNTGDKNTFSKIEGNRNIQSSGSNGINNTGSNNKFN